MNRETRRKLRAGISYTHIALQFVLLWMIFNLKAEKASGHGPGETTALFELILYIGSMVAIFCVQFSAMKLLSDGHHSHQS